MCRKTCEEDLLHDVWGKSTHRRNKCLVSINVIHGLVALGRELANERFEAEYFLRMRYQVRSNCFDFEVGWSIVGMQMLGEWRIHMIGRKSQGNLSQSQVGSLILKFTH
jgi:hypothetical protein